MTADRERIVMLGAGGQAIETFALCGALGIEVAACLDDPGHQDHRRELPSPIYSLADADAVAELSELDAVCAVGSPALRRRWSTAWTPTSWRTLVHPTAQVDESAQLGCGVTVAALASIGPRVRVGAHTLVNVGASLAHETVVGEFATIGPGARIAGRCSVGDGALVGIAAVVSDRVRIGEGAIVGAGAVVIEALEAGSISAGNPASRLRYAGGWA